MILCPIKEYFYFLFFYFEEKMTLFGTTNFGISRGGQVGEKIGNRRKNKNRKNRPKIQIQSICKEFLISEHSETSKRSEHFKSQKLNFSSIPLIFSRR
jgi:hypothetical protein